MSNQVVKIAALLRISPETRTETIVSYICSPKRGTSAKGKVSWDTWNELVDLINDPACYLKAQQFLWDQDPNDNYIEWELLRPATMSLKCGYNDLSQVYRTLTGFLGSVKKGSDSNKTIIKLLGLLTGSGINPLSAETYKLLENCLSGTFHVEFATYTNHLTVIYYPPLVDYNEANQWKYSGTLTSFELLRTSSNGGGTIHVDIESTARGRAKFYASLAHSPEWLYREFESNFFGEQTAIHKPINSGASPILTSKPTGANRKIKIERSVTKFGEYHPDITITGLSEVAATSPGCLQCGFVPASTYDTLRITNKVGVKYSRMKFQPKETVEEILREAPGQ